MAHLAVYIYTAIPIFMTALKSGSVASTVIGTLLYISLHFKFVSTSLEELNKIEDFDSKIEQNTVSSLDEQHTGEKSTYRNIKVSATDGETIKTPKEAQKLECCNTHKHIDTIVTASHCVNDHEHKKDSDRSPSDNKSTPVKCVLSIIKNHQEAIR
jgi:hypothetical protein